MANKEAGVQFILPGFENLKKVFTEKRPAQPREGAVRKLNGHELLYDPLNLKFRGEINRWLQTLEFPLTQVLTEDEERIVKLYLYPQERGKWLTQREAIETSPVFVSEFTRARNFQKGRCSEVLDSRLEIRLVPK